MVRDGGKEQGRKGRKVRKIRQGVKSREVSPLVGAYRLSFGAASIQGGRDYQEDSYGIHPQMSVFFVADGMGGHSFGKEAAEAATSTITEMLDAEMAEPAGRSIGSYFDAAQRAVRRTGGNTTLVMAVYHAQKGQISVAWAGDSGAVAISPGGDYHFLTEPHGHANIVAKYLGGPPGSLLWEPEVRLVQLEGPVRIVIYSDGLDPVLDAEVPAGGWDMGSSEKMRGYSPQTCRKLWGFDNDHLNDAAMMLCREAVDRGSTDNCTAIVLDFSEE